MNKGSRPKRRKDSQKTDEGPGERKKCLNQMQNDRCFAEPLPYEPSSLDWDRDHRINRQNCYCYCGGTGCWMEMVQCHECRQWFHHGCIKCPTDSLVSGDLMYVFFCSSCFQEEYYVRLKVTWGDLVYLAILNLEKQKRNEKYFDLETDIYSWISGHWCRLKAGQLNKVGSPDRMKELEKALRSDEIRFRFARCEGMSRRMRWGLVQSLPLSPSYVDFRELSPPVPLHRATALRNRLTAGQTLTAAAKEASNSRVSITKKSSARICKSSAACKEPVTRLAKLKSKSNQKRVNGSLLHSSVVTLEPPSFQTVSMNNIQTSGILDRLIPVSLNYDGINHPFKTDNEQQIEMERARRRAAALSLCCLKSVDSAAALDGRTVPSRRQHQSASNLLNFSGVDIANHPKSPGKRGRRKSLPTALNNDDDDIPLAQMRAQLQPDVAEDGGGQWGRPLARRISNNSTQYLMEWNEQIL